MTSWPQTASAPFLAHAVACPVCGDTTKPVLCAVGVALWRPTPVMASAGRMTAKHRRSLAKLGAASEPNLVEDDAA